MRNQHSLIQTNEEDDDGEIGEVGLGECNFRTGCEGHRVETGKVANEIHSSLDEAAVQVQFIDSHKGKTRQDGQENSLQ
jgi:hypothetical protein